MLTARDDELDKVLGLELGADDYITKPFSIREFRSPRAGAPAPGARAAQHGGRRADEIAADGLVIDVAAAHRRGARRAPSQLTYVEFELLRDARGPPRPGLQPAHAARGALGRRRLTATRARSTSTSAICARSSSADSRKPEFILTVRSVGYRFRDPLNPLRTVGGRLALALASSSPARSRSSTSRRPVAPALARQRAARRSSAQSRDRHSSGSRAPAGVDQDYVEDAAHAAGATRACVFAPTAAEPDAMLVRCDSHQLGLSRDVEHDPIARRALAQRTRSVAAGSTRDGTTYAEAAVPVERGDRVLLFAAAAQHARVGRGRPASRDHLGRSRDPFAIVLGYALATLFARRIRRLEPRRSGSRTAASTSPSSTRRRTSSASSRGRSSGCGCSSPRSTGRAREFIANASHELRTPLFSLAGFLELLADEELDAETRDEFIDDDAEQVSRLTKLATDLLDLSRLDAGRMRLERERSRWRDAATTCAEEFGAVAHAADHPLEVVVERDGRPCSPTERRAPDRPDPRRQRDRPHAAGHAGPDRRPRPGRWRSTTTGRGSRRGGASRSSSASTGSAARLPPAAGSGSRSPGSSPS